MSSSSSFSLPRPLFRFLLLLSLLLLLLASPSLGKKADWPSRYMGNWRMNVFRGSKKTGVLSDAFSALFLSLNDYDSAGNAICGICYMADGRYFVRIALSSPCTGTIYTAHESASDKSKPSVVATITSDEGDVYAIENYSSFGVDKLTFHKLLSFEMRNFSSDYITSHGSFVSYTLFLFYTQFIFFDRVNTACTLLSRW